MVTTTTIDSMFSEIFSVLSMPQPYIPQPTIGTHQVVVDGTL